MKRPQAPVPLVPQDQPQEEAMAWPITQRINSVFTRGPFPIVIAPLQYTPKKSSSLPPRASCHILLPVRGRREAWGETRVLPPTALLLI